MLIIISAVFLMGGVLEKLKQLFGGQKLEVVMIGLENSGKTTLLNQLSMGDSLPTAPTIGLNVKTVKKGGVTMKMWDLGGQVQYRPEWGRYAKGCDAILFVVDTSNKDALPLSKKELHNLLDERDLNGVPILIIGNKIDVKPSLRQDEIITGLNLDYVVSNPWVVVMISALHGTNLPEVVDWLVKRSRGK